MSRGDKRETAVNAQGRAETPKPGNGHGHEGDAVMGLLRGVKFKVHGSFQHEKWVRFPNATGPARVQESQRLYFSASSVGL